MHQKHLNYPLRQRGAAHDRTASADRVAIVLAFGSHWSSRIGHQRLGQYAWRNLRRAGCVGWFAKCCRTKNMNPCQ